MNKGEKDHIRTIINLHLVDIFPDSVERENVIDSIHQDVIRDIDETADADFNNDDILIALRRVLYKRIIP